MPRPGKFETTAQYWEDRYAIGGNSGAGSYGRLAVFKAEFVNCFVRDHGIKKVIEFGCGDGNQLSHAHYLDYTGLDLAPAAIETCKAKFRNDSTKRFFLIDDYDGRRADLALSLDVIFHLIEQETFEHYMSTLFNASERFVVVYSSNRYIHDPNPHVLHRNFTDWVAESRRDYVLISQTPNAFPWCLEDPKNTSPCDFFVFERVKI